MSFDYAKSSATVTRLLERFGQAMTLKRGGGTIDPVTGAVTGAGSTTLAVTGVMMNYPQRMIDGTRITSGDRKVIVDFSIKPELSDTLTVDGKDWAIQEIIASNPGGTPLRYEIRVRK